MRASGDHVFTERDVKLFDSARETFDMWLPPVLRQLRAGAERRGVGSSFDEVLDRVCPGCVCVAGPGVFHPD